MLRVNYLLAFKGKAVWTIGPEVPVLAAIQLMADKHIGALPVMRDEELIGIVSERDYARKVILQGKSSKEITVADIMSTPVLSVRPEDTVHDCMALMTSNHIRHLPVAGAAGPIGMVSIGDVVKALLNEQAFTIEQLEHYIRG